MPSFRTGDHVVAFPSGRPEAASPATVTLISGNQLAMALLMDDKPRWAISEFFLDASTSRIALLLIRNTADDDQWTTFEQTGRHFMVKPATEI